MGVGATEPRAIRDSRQIFPSISRDTATFTMERDMAWRRPNLRNTPFPFGQPESITSVKSSSGLITVFPGPVKKSLRAIARVPFSLLSTASASSAKSAQARSAAGEALTMFPPIVPRFRIRGPPTEAAACARRGRSVAGPRIRLFGYEWL